MKYQTDDRPGRDQLRALHGALWETFKGHCAYCTARCQPFGVESAVAATIDHYVPLGRGGSWAFDNLRLACWTCNNDKGDLTPDAWHALRNTTKRHDIHLTKYERKLAAYALIHQRKKAQDADLQERPERTGTAP